MVVYLAELVGIQPQFAGYVKLYITRELGLNPDKFGKIDNHRQESCKAPLPQFIESICFKRFKREEPETVKPLKQIMAEMKAKKKL